MPEYIDVETFLELRKTIPVVDVRSPAEFQQGRIPGAFNIPLMENAERAVVGTVYKHNGKQPAILKGLELAGPKLKEYIRNAKKIPNNNNFIVHCWRGGMRSGFLSWLLEFYGFRVYVLKGGYKAFRKRMMDEFTKNRTLAIVGGRTGSGKTYVLHELKKNGEQVIDLEALAHHKGSSFGALGQTTQPTQEQFENELGLELVQCNNQRRIWLEDESRTIGNKVMPETIWKAMREAPVYFLDIPFEKRLEHIVRDYGIHPLEDLIAATERIAKRLGPEQSKHAVLALREGKLQEGLAYSLRYYDKTYEHNLSKREKASVQTIAFASVDPPHIAQILHQLAP